MNDFKIFTEYVFSLVRDFWDIIQSNWWVAAMFILIVLHAFLPDHTAEEERDRKALNRANRRRLK